MPEKTHAGPPMDLANMRENGVHSIAVYCLDCNRRADVNVDNFAGDIAGEILRAADGVWRLQESAGSRPACMEYEARVYPEALTHLERAIVSRAPMAGRDREQDNVAA